MLELLVVVTFFGYIYYLRNYADLRSKSEKEEAEFSSGVEMYKSGRFDEAYEYFDKKVSEKPKSCIAYLYRGLAQKGKGNVNEAFNDIQTAVSLDDEAYKAHLEFGKLYMDANDYETALSKFNKAIIKAGETSPESYQWRGKTYLKLGRQAEAQEDFETEKRLIEQSGTGRASVKVKAPFVDKKLIVSMVMVVFTSLLIILVVKDAESVHLPYLVAVFSAIVIGFVEPHKGWLLALMQCILVLSGYFLFTTQPETSGSRELENFSLYGSVILTFVASFLGGFMKRALNMQ
jgi:tetratricopeptide (TPR) repeat protein